MLKIPQECFLPHNLVKPLKIEQDFDLVVSLEVAEHLPLENAEQFVDTLVSLSPAILFSAAVPYQPGKCHFNGQWPDYWISHFHQRGYIVFDCLRMKLWQNENVEWWYSQNMLFFVKESCLDKYPLLKQEVDNSNIFITTGYLQSFTRQISSKQYFTSMFAVHVYTQEFSEKEGKQNFS
jgi:hypothetical protein